MLDADRRGFLHCIDVFEPRQRRLLLPQSARDGLGRPCGHGDKAPGACYHGLRECDVALEAVNRIGRNIRLLSKAGDARSAPEIGTAFTRTDGADVSIGTRATMVRNFARASNGKSLLVVVHCNASTNPLARGTEVLVSPEGNFKVTSNIVAAEILSRLQVVGMRSRGVKLAQPPHIRFASLGILRETCWHLPAAYIELGFISNKADAGMLADPVSLEVMSIAIARAVLETHFGIRPRMELLNQG